MFRENIGVGERGHTAEHNRVNHRLNETVTVDGYTYSAIQQAITALKARGGGELVFPPGLYTIDVYKIEGGPGLNGVTDLVIEDLSNFCLSGYGALLDMKGDFQRGDDFNNHLSYSNGVKLSLRNCSNFGIEGLTIDGNVDQMTRAALVNEDGGAGLIRTNGCRDYVIRNCHLHHGQTDGLQIGGAAWYGDDVGLADRNGRIENVLSEYNARQGISIIQARGIEVVNSRFVHTGQSAGMYGYHNPGYGADVEPAVDVGPYTDVRTGAIAYRNCVFEDNIGGQAITGNDAILETVFFDTCEFTPGTGGADVVLRSPYTRLQNVWMNAARLWLPGGASRLVSGLYNS